MNDWEKRIAVDVNKYADRDIYNDTETIVEESDSLAAGIIGILLSWACQPQNTTSIVIARNRLLQFPKAWLEEKIKATAAMSVDVTDDWEYRRLLELSESISKDLLKWAIQLGENSSDDDIREAVEDFTMIAEEKNDL